MRLRSLRLFALLVTTAAVVDAQTNIRARVGLPGYRDPIAMDTLASR
jgi:hypothetical protein